MMFARGPHRRILAASGMVGALMMASLVGANVAGLRINGTPSMPRGLWQVVANDTPLRRGEIVTVCPPDTKLDPTGRGAGLYPRRTLPGWIRAPGETDRRDGR